MGIFYLEVTDLLPKVVQYINYQNNWTYWSSEVKATNYQINLELCNFLITLHLESFSASSIGWGLAAGLTLTPECSMWTCSFLPHSFSLNLDLLAAIMPLAISLMTKHWNKYAFYHRCFCRIRLVKNTLKLKNNVQKPLVQKALTFECLELIFFSVLEKSK